MKPTLFDRVKAEFASGYLNTLYGYRASIGASKDHGPWHRASDLLRRAVPFHIDGPAVRAARDVRQKFVASRRDPLIDLALVPFECTWIEYNPRDKFNDMDTNPRRVETSPYYGHLIYRQDQGVTVLSFEQPDGRGQQPHILPWVINWTSTAARHAPWRFITGEESRPFGDNASENITARLLGCARFKQDDPYAPIDASKLWLPSWYKRLGGDITQPNTDNPEEARIYQKMWVTTLDEHVGAAALLMSLLAMIAWVPCEFVESKRKGMFLHRNKPRVYMDFKTVKLHIPIKTVYLHIKKGHAMTRHRRHRVREHFRVLHAGTPREKRVVVHEHLRGDASLGFVRQDYEVTT